MHIIPPDKRSKTPYHRVFHNFGVWYHSLFLISYHSCWQTVWTPYQSIWYHRVLTDLSVYLILLCFVLLLISIVLYIVAAFTWRCILLLPTVTYLKFVYDFIYDILYWYLPGGPSGSLCLVLGLFKRLLVTFMRRTTEIMDLPIRSMTLISILVLAGHQPPPQFRDPLARFIQGAARREQYVWPRYFCCNWWSTSASGGSCRQYVCTLGSSGVHQYAVMISYSMLLWYDGYHIWKYAVMISYMSRYDTIPFNYDIIYEKRRGLTAALISQLFGNSIAGHSVTQQRRHQHANASSGKGGARTGDRRHPVLCLC